jgi:hypothetical protein
MARHSKSIRGHAPRMRLYGSESEMMAWVRSALSSQTRRIASHASYIWAKRRQFGSGGPSKPIATVQRRVSISPPPSPILGGYLKRGQKQRRDLRSTPSSASPAFAPSQRVATRLFSPDANTSTTDCARQEPPRPADPPRSWPSTSAAIARTARARGRTSICASPRALI